LHRLRTICLICCLLLLGACSSTTFVYNRLDFFLPWYLDRYAELDREQEQYLNELLVPFLAWHRSRELPRYVELLDAIERSLDQPMTATDVEAISLQFEAAWFRLQDRLLDWLLDLGARLSDRQVEDFLDKLWEKQEKYEEKYLERSDQEYREDSFEDLLDSLQDYLGRLDREQRAVLREASEQLLRADHIWLNERAAWLEHLRVLLQRQPGWQQRVRDAVARQDENVSVAYRQTYNHNLRVIHTALAEVLNGRTDKQDRRLRKKLSSLREDLETLIAQGEAAAA